MGPECTHGYESSVYFKPRKPWCIKSLMPFISMPAWDVVGTFQETEASIWDWATARAPAAISLVGNGAVCWKDGTMHRIRVSWKSILSDEVICMWLLCIAFLSLITDKVRLNIIYLCTGYMAFFVSFHTALIFAELKWAPVGLLCSVTQQVLAAECTGNIQWVFMKLAKTLHQNLSLWETVQWSSFVSAETLIHYIKDLISKSWFMVKQCWTVFMNVVF